MTPPAADQAGLAAPGEATAPAAVCLGESMAMLIPEPAGPLELAEGFRHSYGGAESNTACTLAALGVPAAWVSRVGADGFGRRLVERIAAHGVDTSGVVADPARPTGLYVKETGSGADHPYDLGAGRSRLHYYRRGSAASAMGPDLLTDPAAEPLLAAAELVHLTGITPALSDSCHRLVRTLLAVPGRLVSFDLNWRPALWAGRDRQALRFLMNAADVVLFGADEAREVLGTDEPVALRKLLPRPAVLVLKDDARQASSIAPDGTVTTEPALRVEVVEPTGAGDAFAAGYLAGTLRGLPEPARLRLGHLAAAAALTSRGDLGTPPPAELRDRLLAAGPDAWAATTVDAEGYHPGAA
ncbi:Putative 2-oxo-3-deoxy-gluconate kinase [Kitasatospora sp. MMS16-BH015]|uniref:sugar kinase n=1 Tax=Kitasatospora sp. MMS16-BH015 TaxID=2018025 RepID=UPI000CA3EBE5|nr:sugar kinase [Kitasatospora sp. MMS16-BH015]AUG77014.1 Putative 2-oxo-3-deoxy-gluconate kinase [Kitasatospora sp. MMS16-BH015]